MVIEMRYVDNVEVDDVIYESKDVIIVAHETTCWECKLNKDCEYRFDPYNINGDCLAEK